MSKYQIAWLPGDGVGNDVMAAARIVLDALKFDAEYIQGDIGWEFWCNEGNPLPDRTIEILKNTDACLFGAVTSKPEEEAMNELAPELQGRGLTYTSPIVRLRQEFNLHTNLRPCKAYPGNPLNHQDDIDLVIFRENTEGLYVGIEFHPLPEDFIDAIVKHESRMNRFAEMPPSEIAVSLRLNTKSATRSIVTRAFEYAKQNGRKNVTLVDKPNVLRETGGMVSREARKVAANFPEIELWEANIDAMCMWLIKNPQKYGVLVATNMFGDIISDLCAQLVGGLGFAASANIGDNYAVFEPTHGSAPKYAGQYKVNPIAMILSTSLMLEWFGEIEAAQRLEKAVAAVILEGKVRTFDMGGMATTLEMAEAVTAKLD